MESNPNKRSSVVRIPAHVRSRVSVFQAGLNIFVVALIVVVVPTLIAMLWPSVGSRVVEPRTTCMNNLRQIATCILVYESNHGTLPPAYTVDAEGNRLHSWRTLILPYLEQEELYASIDLSKPWDDPANAEAREGVIGVYRCPSATHKEGLTTYLDVFGADCIFSGSVPRKFEDIADGPSNTLLLVDVASDQAVHWMSPYDVSEEALLAIGPDSQTNHSGALLAIFLDGHVDWIPLDSDRDKLRAMLTIAGGEDIGE